MRKLLLLFFNDTITALLLLIIYASTNLFITFSRQFDLPHLFLFALNALFLYLLFRGDKRNIDKKDLRNAAIVLGLTAAIRPTQALFGIIPLVILLDQYGFTKTFWKRISVFFVWGLIWALPQVIYSIQAADKIYFLNLHSEVIAFSDPHIFDFLFSFKKGWLLYSPVFLLLPFAFVSLYKKDRLLFISFSTFVLINIYVLSSWENWWYATSFGSRVMVDAYPLFAVILGFLFIGSEKWVYKIALGIFVLISTLFNILQSYQYRKGFIDFSRMTKQHYFYVFGKTSIPDYHRNYLEMDRSDIHWMEKMEKIDYPEYEFYKINLFKLSDSLILSNKDKIEIAQIKVSDDIPSDEVSIQLSIKAGTKDPNQSCKAWFILESEYKKYSWKEVEIVLEDTSNTINEYNYKFNLPHILHKNDVLKVYLEKHVIGSIKIENIIIDAVYLKRK